MPSHDEFKRGASACQDREVIIGWRWFVCVAQGAWNSVFETQLSASGIQQFFKKVWVFFAKQEVKACQERVAVA